MSLKKKPTLDVGARFRLVCLAYQEVTPEHEAKVRNLLEQMGAEDLLDMLGLSVPQETNSESEVDVNVAV